MLRVAGGAKLRVAGGAKLRVAGEPPFRLRSEPLPGEGLGWGRPKESTKTAASSGPRTGQAMPTTARPPGEWVLPFWLAWPPVAVSVLILGLAGVVLSWWWVGDAQSAAIVRADSSKAQQTKRAAAIM